MSIGKRTLQVILLVVQPFKYTADVVSWGQVMLYLGVQVLAPISIQYIGVDLPKVSPIVVALVVPLILLFWAAYRLQGRVDEQKEQIGKQKEQAAILHLK